MEKAKIYKKFWTLFVERPDCQLSSNKKLNATERGSLSLGTVKGLSYWYVLKDNGVQVAFYIDRPKNKEANKQLFDSLRENAGVMEKACGSSFAWERLDYANSCRIRFIKEIGDLEDRQGDWKMIQADMIESMSQFLKALDPFLKKYA